MSIADDLKPALNNCIEKTCVDFLSPPYRGKVRDVYALDDHTLGIVVTDRISAFDHIMRQAIPYKGQILNMLSAFNFKAVEDLVPIHVINVPHPNITIAKKCSPIPVEVVIRGYLTGHAWRVYKSGCRELCGVRLPDHMKEHEKFPEPILTPATKAIEGHDEDIPESEIINQGLVSKKLWETIRSKAFELFRRGTEVAADRGLILVDTKYEFGLFENELTLIDEVHTADSSRYFYVEGYDERLDRNEPQKQLSKEFLREWLMENGFRGLEGQTLPDLPDEFRIEVFTRYKELFEKLTGRKFVPESTEQFNTVLGNIFQNYRSNS